MEKTFKNGYAFILEGDTEKEFYYALLEHLCKKYNVNLARIVDKSSPDISYELQIDNEVMLIKFNTVNTITQIPRTGKWFKTQCVGRYGTGVSWYVFLCYDKDDYKEDISKFHEGDWAILRESLKKAKQIVDVAAAADIEDVMLQDINHICSFIGCSPPVVLNGRKGKSKMKNLFKEHGMYYHEGKRAKNLINALDMDFLIDNDIVPLKEIERLIFE